MPNQQTATKTTSRPRKCRVTISVDEETIQLLDAWRTPITWIDSRSRGVAALIGIALGDTRWGKNSPGFGAARTPTPGYEAVSASRPCSEATDVCRPEPTSSLPSRTTSTGQVLCLVPSKRN